LWRQSRQVFNCAVGLYGAFQRWIMPWNIIAGTLAPAVMAFHVLKGEEL
jgi:hypothetical protein